MDHPSFYSLLYAIIVLNIGVGSWLFHANLRTYGGVWDVTSMNMYMTFLLFYSQAQTHRKSEKWFIAWWLPVNIVLLYEQIFINKFNTAVFTILVAVTAFYELYMLTMIKWNGSLNGLWRNWIPFVIGFVVFNVGFVVWNLTNTGRPLCDPTTLWQGHGFWHLSTAVATFCFFLYMRSQRESLPQQTVPSSIDSPMKRDYSKRIKVIYSFFALTTMIIALVLTL